MTTSRLLAPPVRTGRAHRSPEGLCYAIAALFSFCSVAPSSAQTPNACDALGTLKLADVTITAATPVEPGAFRAPGASATAAGMNTPAFCRVAATLTPTAESHIRIELWMPPANAWNGKFLGTGNGGAGGAISYPALAAGLQKGYAVTNTDMGTSTTGLDFSFGVGHREMVVDWGYRATHLMTVVAKQIAKTYYTREAQQSYFMGCSTGGHQAITEARRYPEDYNGIVAGDPANNRVRLHMNGYWAYEATHADPASYIPPSKLPMINKAVLNACDTIDGLADGIIDDPRKCTFDPSTIQCSGADAADCLTPPQVAAMKKIYQGPKNPRTGELIFPGMYVGSEVNPLGLDRTLANAPGSGRPEPPPGLAIWTGWKGPGYDWDKDASRVISELSPLLDDADPDLSAFRKRGGKLLLYTGWADPLIPAADTLHYYEGLQKKMGGAQATADFARLFMVPGMGHCAGGNAPTRFDALAALEPWVEQSTPPEQMIAAQVVQGATKRTRPICVYPQVAKWNGTGSQDDAASFSCTAR
ncbi:MAG: Tannase and feruloyl esterase [Acidobacteria bacterium]|nr:Tannase and feruloyl esterase [Acidobacteriota bacterium]